MAIKARVGQLAVRRRPTIVERLRSRPRTTSRRLPVEEPPSWHSNTTRRLDSASSLVVPTPAPASRCSTARLRPTWRRLTTNTPPKGPLVAPKPLLLLRLVLDFINRTVCNTTCSSSRSSASATSCRRRPLPRRPPRRLCSTTRPRRIRRAAPLTVAAVRPLIKQQFSTTNTPSSSPPIRHTVRRTKEVKLATRIRRLFRPTRRNWTARWSTTRRPVAVKSKAAARRLS